MKKKTFFDREDVFCIFLVFVLLFGGVSVLVMGGSESEKEKEDEETTTTTQEPETEEPVQSPVVFSGGTVPTLNETGTATETEIQSELGILVRMSDGAVLYEKEANTKFQPASLTKIMTLVVAVEHLTEEDLENTTTFTQELYDQFRTIGNRFYGSSGFGFDVGDEVKLSDLLYGIAVKSAGDCSAMVAEYVAGSQDAFVKMMNEKAKALGMWNTQFDNVVGVEGESNYSTPYDLAILCAYALQCPLLKTVFSAKSHVFYYSGYNSSGAWVEGARGTFSSTVFGDTTSRMSSYKAKNGTFTLAKGNLVGGKSGTLEEPSYIFSLFTFAEYKNETYICITGNVTTSAGTLEDAKVLYDTYIQ